MPVRGFTVEKRAYGDYAYVVPWDMEEEGQLFLGRFRKQVRKRWALNKIFTE